MWFALKNHNIDSAYQLIPTIFECRQEFDKKTGMDYTSINLSDLTDMLSLDGICRTCNEYYKHLVIDGMTIRLEDGTR